MRVLFFGSRDWHEQGPIYGALVDLQREYLNDLVVITGGARGADAISDYLARRLGIATEVYPADWRQYGRSAGPIRNQGMLDTGIDAAFGFRYGKVSKGTDDMLHRCVKAGVPVRMVAR